MAKIDFLILGATGMQGDIVVRDLLERDYKLFLSSKYPEDLDEISSRYALPGARAVDLRDTVALRDLIAQADPTAIINCAEGDWNADVYRMALKYGTHVIDLGSDIPMTRGQLAMDGAFRERGFIAITGCGSTPGINNIMLAHAVDGFDSIKTIEVGFAWNSMPKKFVVPFSMESIFEEFVDRAPIIEAGEWVEKVPMETVSEREFRAVGKQKCFFVRHPETFTFHHYFKDKGVENVYFYAGFPKHSFDIIATYVNNGDIARDRTIDVPGRGVVPLSEATRALMDIFPRPPGYSETENLWVSVVGQQDGQEKTTLMECIVPPLSGWEEAGCNIDTGFPASIIGQMVLDGTIADAGSFAPEHIVPRDAFFRALQERGMTVLMDGKTL